jgi:hypothetical protein
MAYTVDKSTYKVDVELPQALQHKPIYAMPYSPFDGPAANDIDAKYLSIGLSQWNQSEVSANVMRHSGEQWSPQSEEMPIHRVVDLTLFIAKALFDSRNYSLRLPGGLFQNQSNCLIVTAEEARSKSELEGYDHWLADNGEAIRERLRTLSVCLNDLSARGLI